MGVTFKVCIKKAEQRKDGMWRVKILITHNGKNSYISTHYYVNKHQLTKRSLEIIDRTILDATGKIVDFFRRQVVLIGPDIEKYEIKELSKLLQEKYKAAIQQSNGIDFIAFAKKHRDKLINHNREKYANSINSTILLLEKYSVGTTLNTDDITVKWLENTESRMLLTMKQNSANIHLRNIRTLFNAARDEYNDEDRDIILIKHYPFRKFKFKTPLAPAKRNLDVDTIRKIISFPDTDFERVNMSRDIFALSFAMLGMNTIDLYHCSVYDGERITYHRHKTSRRKGDRAKLSILVMPEIKDIVSRYLDKSKGSKFVFDFHRRYISSDSFSQNINKGLLFICEKLGLDQKITTYFARHSFATIARNDCGISKDDIAMCLTHSSGHDITDIYLNEDLSVIDKVQKKVAELVFM